ncbi:MAG TPA: phage regulatory CII family protein [Phycisphaerae bacterium]|nr:phage regulatory CII family protein [Phycisphaerae bacterium]
MRSHEMLREATEGIGVKALAAKLRLSPALIYKWCQEADPDDPDSSGARNPLDRCRDIVSATGNTGVVNWLCHEAGGFYVSNPSVPRTDLDTELLVSTQHLVEEFSRLLVTVTRSIEDDGRIDPTEADRIRRAWERLKGTAEKFTVACERGVYRPDEDKKKT